MAAGVEGHGHGIRRDGLIPRLVGHREGGEAAGLEDQAAVDFGHLHILNSLSVSGDVDVRALGQVVVHRQLHTVQRSAQIVKLAVQAVVVDDVDGLAGVDLLACQHIQSVQRPVDGDVLLRRHIGVAVAGIHQVQILVLEGVVVSKDAPRELLCRILQQLRACGRSTLGFYVFVHDAVGEQVDLAAVDRDLASVNVIDGAFLGGGRDAVDVIHVNGIHVLDRTGGAVLGGAADDQIALHQGDAAALQVAAFDDVSLVVRVVYIDDRVHLIRIHRAGVQAHGVLFVSAVQMDLELVAGDIALFSFDGLAHNLETDGILILFAGHHTVDVPVVGGAVCTVFIVERQGPDTCFIRTNLVLQLYVLRQVHRAGSSLSNCNSQVLIQPIGQSEVIARLRQTVGVFFHVPRVIHGITASIRHDALVAVAAAVDGDVRGTDDDLLGVGGAVAVLVIAPHGVDRGNGRDRYLGNDIRELLARVEDVSVQVNFLRCFIGERSAGGPTDEDHGERAFVLTVRIHSNCVSVLRRAAVTLGSLVLQGMEDILGRRQFGLSLGFGCVASPPAAAGGVIGQRVAGVVSIDEVDHRGTAHTNGSGSRQPFLIEEDR